MWCTFVNFIENLSPNWVGLVPPALSFLLTGVLAAINYSQGKKIRAMAEDQFAREHPVLNAVNALLREHLGVFVRYGTIFDRLRRTI